MEDTIKKLIALSPAKALDIEAIWQQRKHIETFDILLDGNVRLTNDPELMIMCGATIPSSYSPDSPSFPFLPTLVLQPYIGMLYVPSATGDKYTIETKAGNITAPEYACRAFVIINKDREILAKMPTYSLMAGCDWLDDYATTNAVAVKSQTPPIQIHLDCIDQYKMDDGHMIVCGSYIQPQEFKETSWWKKW